MYCHKPLQLYAISHHDFNQSHCDVGLGLYTSIVKDFSDIA